MSGKCWIEMLLDMFPVCYYLDYFRVECYNTLLFSCQVQCMFNHGLLYTEAALYPLSVSSISSAVVDSGVVDLIEICWNGLSNVLFREHRDCHGLQTVSFLAPSNTHSCSGAQSLQHNIGKEAIYKWILVWWRKKSWAVGHEIPKMALATYEFMAKQQKNQYQWFFSFFIARRVVSPVLRPYVISQPNTHKTPAK